jgi:hypothetical protein
MGRATSLLEEENSIHENMKWMNAVAETLHSCGMIPGANIVLEWLNNYDEKCLEKLPLVESELNELVSSYSQNVLS